MEDKNQYENVGGGISVGFDNRKPKVPNVKISHDKIDKEQINRASAINTEFVIAGEEKTSEELGFNADLTKAQETTKDEEKHLNADLHTDLTNKEERDKLVLAGRKIETVIENIADNKGTTTANAYKAGLRGIHVDEVRKEKQKEFNFADDKNTEPLDMQRALIDLQAQIYEKEGYKGPLPKIYLTDEPNSFAVDGKNGEPRKIFISINDLKRGEASAILYAHENAHLVHYDKGEEMAKYAETKIGENNPNIKFTEREKEAYVQDLRKRIEVEPLEKQFEIARNIDKNDRENYEAIVIDKEITFKAGGIRGGTGIIYNNNQETGEEEYGIVTFIQPEIGPNLASGGIGIKSYRKPNASIEDFQGMFGTVKGIAGYGLRGSAEMEINGVNNVNYRVDITVGSGTIGLLSGIGYRKVSKINPPVLIKERIKEILKKEKSIVNTYETIDKLKDIIEYTENLK